MELSRIIQGPIVTEKSERLKLSRCYSIKVHPKATKVDVIAALKKYYDVDVQNVSVMRVRGKVRLMRGRNPVEKRHPYKKAMITLTSDSKTLDLAAFTAA